MAICVYFCLTTEKIIYDRNVNLNFQIQLVLVEQSMILPPKVVEKANQFRSFVSKGNDNLCIILYDNS